MESNTKPVTLEEMATKHVKWLCKDGDGANWAQPELSHLFISGAQWQKEQDKEMLKLLIEIKNELYPSVGEINVQLFDKIRETIIKYNH